MKATFKLIGLVVFIAFGTTAFVHPKMEMMNTSEDDKMSFAKFLSYFQKIDLGYEVGLDDFETADVMLKKLQLRGPKLESKIDQKQLIRHLQEVEHSLYSRMGPPEILPLARFYPDDQSVAVIYIPYRSFGHSANFTYKLAFFDLRGNSLPKLNKKRNWKEAFVLGHNRLEEAITFRIDESGYIWQNHYEKIWKEDIQKQGIVDNEVKEHKLQKTNVVKITGDGNLVAVDAYPTDAKAKL